MKPRFAFFAIFIFTCSFVSPSRAQHITLQKDSLFDAARNRPLPLRIYAPEQGNKLKPAILSHGYGGFNDAYGFIAGYLAAHGYYVVSIQHDLPGDKPVPSTGKPYEVRMPFWKQGSDNILFVVNALKKKQPGLDYKNLLLVGHSNGGDMSMLFAREHPELVAKVISLDNRRMPFPRAARPQVLSLRSSDQPADSGVIPTPAEQARYHTTVVKLPATKHNDMWDGASNEQKAEMLRYIGEFLGIK